MSPRPLALVLGLTAGDYLLWNWSLGGNHDVTALVSGLTLPPLAAASILVIATAALRLVARLPRRFAAGGVARDAEPGLRVRRVTPLRQHPEAPPPTPAQAAWVAEPVPGVEDAEVAAAVADQRRPSRKLAA